MLASRLAGRGSPPSVQQCISPLRPGTQGDPRVDIWFESGADSSGVELDPRAEEPVSSRCSVEKRRPHDVGSVRVSFLTSSSSSSFSLMQGCCGCVRPGAYPMTFSVPRQHPALVESRTGLRTASFLRRPGWLPGALRACLEKESRWCRFSLFLVGMFLVGLTRMSPACRAWTVTPSSEVHD